MLPFRFALAVRQCFQTRAKPSQPGSHQRAVVLLDLVLRSLVLLSPMKGPEKQGISGPHQSNQTQSAFGKNWLLCVVLDTLLAMGPAMAPTTAGHSGHISACSTELTLPSWQIVIYAFRSC